MHHITDLGKRLGGKAGKGVGLVNGGGNAPLGGGLYHRVGGVAAGTHHQIRPELIQNGFGLAVRLCHVGYGFQVVADGGGLQGAAEVGDGHGFQGKALLGDQTGLHPAVGTYEEDVGAVPLPEHPGQGHGRVDMAGGTAAGEENVHRLPPVEGRLSALFWRGDLAGDA